MFGLPTGWLAAGALALLIATGGGAYLKGRSDAAANCRAAALQAELATVRRDLHLAREAAATAEAAQRTLSAEAETANQRIAEYERTLQGRDACALSPDDVALLERLRGKSGGRDP